MLKYSDAIKTPHPDTPGVNADQLSILSRSPEFLAIEEELNTSPNTYDDRVSASYALAGLVRRSLRFANDSPVRPPLTPNNLSHDQTTNCYGYTVVLSEMLESVDLQHSIVVANQHSFAAMTDETTKNTSMVDAPTRQFYCDISHAFEPDLSTDPPSAVLDSTVIIRQSGYADKSKTEDAHPWLSFVPRSSDSRTISEQRLVRANLLMARIYSPDQGRSVLGHYSRFRNSMHSSNYLGAHKEIVNLKGTYPDIDRRNKLKEPSRLIRELAVASYISESLDVIDVIKSSTQPLSEDSFFKIWPIDMLHKVGKAASSGELIKKSLEQYDNLYESTNSSNLKRLIREKVASRTRV